MKKSFELTLIRTFRGADYTIGHIYMPDEMEKQESERRYYCDTIEDIDRGLNDQMTEAEIARIKVKHETAIPVGRYRVLMDTISPAYAKKANWVQFNGACMPRLRQAEDPTLEVPGFSGVLIHTGNTALDSSGCLLVGQNKLRGKLINSTATFKDLYAILLRHHKAGEEIYITVKRKGE